MSFNNIHYAIQIETNTSFTSTDIGLESGIFRFITGSPSGVLTYEDGSSNNYTWYNNFILQDGLSNPKRSIDLSKAGDYGTLSTFKFKVTNSSLFWTKLKSAYNANLTTNMNLIGSVVKLYSVINNVFYQIWTGSITELPRNHKEFIFNCEDAFVNKYHKDMPSGVLDGKPLPQLFGSGHYVKVYNSGVTNNYEFTINGNKKEVTLLKAILGGEPIINGIGLIFETDDYIIPSGSLKNKFVKFIQGGTDNATFDESQYIQIKDNYYINSFYRNVVIVDNYFKCEPIVEMIKYSGYINKYILDVPEEQSHLLLDLDHPEITYNNNIFFSIVDVSYKYYVSNNDIEIIDKNIYSYDEDLKEFVKSDILINSYSGNYIELNYNSADISGDYEFFSNIPYTITSGMLLNRAYSSGFYYSNPSTWTQLSGNTWTPNSSIINSNDQRTFDVFTVQTPDSFKGYFMRLDLTINDIPKEGDIYILPDMTFSVFSGLIPLTSGISVYIETEYHAKNINNTSMNYDLAENIPLGLDYVLLDDLKGWQVPVSGYYSPSSSGYNSSGTMIVGFNCPNNLYDYNFFNNSGLYIGPETTPKIYKYDDTMNDSYPYFERDPANKEGYIKEYAKVPDEVLRFLRNKITNTIEVYFYIYLSIDSNIMNPYWPQSILTRFHGLKVFQANKTNIDNNIYVNAKSSTINGINTDTVFGTFKAILEVNDEIPSGSINYGNLEVQRGAYTSWEVGRQINQKQNSLQYLQELCQQSYVCMFPTRDGKIKLNSWMDNSITSGVFNDSNILRDSIRDFNYTQMKDISNEFNVNFDLNYANNEFEDHILVINTNKNEFPSSTGIWNDYVNGIDNYNTAKNYWNNAHSGYLLSQKRNTQPTNLQNLYWYNKELAASTFLDYCIRWTSNQHINTSFDIPLNSGNIQYDLSDPISLSNELYTNNVAYSGYITGLEYNLKQNSINLEVILDTNDYEPIEELLIVETGTAPLIYSETGTAPNTIIES